MDKKALALLEKVCQTPGAPGYEKEIRTLVLKEIEGLIDQVELDNMGNIYGIVKGKSDKRVMVGAHMDEIGFIVTHIDENGFIRFNHKFKSKGYYDVHVMVNDDIIASYTIKVNSKIADNSLN